MQALRKFVMLLTMLFFLFLVLVITNLVSVDFMDKEFTRFNPMNFFKIMAVIGAVLLALVLAVEQSHSAFLRRRVGQLESHVNQLKAELYDHKQAVTRSETPPRAAGEPAVPPRPTTTMPRPPEDML